MMNWVVGQRYSVRYRLEKDENLPDSAPTLTDALGHVRTITDSTIVVETRRHGLTEILRSRIVAAKPVPNPPVLRRPQM